jgi:hypothetical protein
MAARMRSREFMGMLPDQRHHFTPSKSADPASSKRIAPQFPSMVCFLVALDGAVRVDFAMCDRHGSIGWTKFSPQHWVFLRRISGRDAWFIRVDRLP